MSWIPVLVRLSPGPECLRCAHACCLSYHLPHLQLHGKLCLYLGAASFACIVCAWVDSNAHHANALPEHAADNFKLFAEREVPLELRTGGGNLANDAGSVEAIRVRVLVCGTQPDLEAVRVCQNTKDALASCDCQPTHCLVAAEHCKTLLQTRSASGIHTCCHAASGPCIVPVWQSVVSYSHLWRIVVLLHHRKTHHLLLEAKEGIRQQPENCITSIRILQTMVIDLLPPSFTLHARWATLADRADK